MKISRIASALTVIAMVLFGGMIAAAPAMAANVSVTIDGVTYTADDATPSAGATVTAFDDSTTTVNIPDTVEISGSHYLVVAIAGQVFQDSDVTTATVGNNVASIGAQAFLRTGLSMLTLGDSVENIEFGAFRENLLTDVVFPDSIQIIGSHSFNNNQIENLDLGESVLTIESGAFRENGLTELTIPASVQTIGNNAFSSNDDLVSVIFTGPAPTVTAAADGGRAFPVQQSLVLSYPWAFDVSEVANGYSSPTWFGYDTQAIVILVDATFGDPVCTEHDGPAEGFPADEGWVTIPETVGVDYFLNGVLAESGATYRLNPGGSNILTAEAQENYKIDADFRQEITIGDVPSWFDCNADTLPEPVVTTVPNSEVDCDEGTITSWETITTTEYVLNETEDGWALDTANAEVTETERVTTEATEEELAECPIPPEEPVVPEEPMTPETPGIDSAGAAQGPSAPSKAGLASTGFGLAPLLLGTGAGMAALGGFLIGRRK